jgi:hypothetical protein
MKPKIREILDRCIYQGLENGCRRAHKHSDKPGEMVIIDEIDHAIWLEINECFIFEDEECTE